MISTSNIELRKLFVFLTSTVLFLISGCEKDEFKPGDDNPGEEKTENEIVNEGIYEIMEDIYLWNDSLPEFNELDSKKPPAEFLSELRYQPIDKWSYILTTTEFNQYFQQGEYKGHGFLISLDDDNKIRIGFVYKQTQAYQKGVRRSWIIKKVNGTDATVENINTLLGNKEQAITNKILFIDKEGQEKELDLTKETIKINAVLHSEIIEHESLKIGYMVFQEFIATANEELETVFQEFTSQGIDELIIDLRYNGGGMNTVAEYLAGWIAGDKSNSVFYKLLHNKNNTSKNVTVNFPANSETLNLDRIYFITTNSSASASELLINGLEPYYDVKIVGTNTSGKPTGMYAYSFREYDYTLVPISFKYVNANNNGDFYDGLSVDYPAEDDKTRDFGDLTESSLKIALDAITGTLTQKSAAEAKETKIIVPSEYGIHQFLRAY